jgi:ATP-dependent Clp protease protease subunit
LYVKHIGLDREKVAKDMDRDFFMSAQESIDYGLADYIAEKK